jgi:hypothetical protein
MADKLLYSATRNPAERGLPDEQARLELATTYLTTQAKLWPGLVKLQIVPKPTSANAARLADEFRERFLNDRVNPSMPIPVEYELGAAYLRYSCDNSNSRSLDQQMKNVLDRAAQDRVFILRGYVFADTAVTGITAQRRG